MSTKIETIITDEQIKALRTEARSAGDAAQVRQAAPAAPADRPELWCALPVDVVSRLPGATTSTQPCREHPGKVVHAARAHVDGLLVVGLETRAEGSVSP